MPIYEYICESDGTVIELIRPMRDADAPVKDPDGKGRAFRRTHSTFGTPASARASGTPSGGCCPCGKNRGPCGMG